MPAEPSAAGILRIVARNDADFAATQEGFERYVSRHHELSRDQVLDYLAQMSTEMQALACSYKCANLAYLFEIASREAENLRQQAAGDLG